MTDMPQWRTWADKAHKDSMKPRGKKKPLFKCSSANCTQRTTKNQAKSSGGYCIYCKSKLRAFDEFARA